MSTLFSRLVFVYIAQSSIFSNIQNIIFQVEIPNLYSQYSPVALLFLYLLPKVISARYPQNVTEYSYLKLLLDLIKAVFTLT